MLLSDFGGLLEVLSILLLIPVMQMVLVLVLVLASICML
jgi:hypothetical protein